ncbi:MAG: hypothetical protein JF886_08005 [Candidatus Dormibacteraeota bacterium]|uniref:Uncharacterized protein n=1 Tax=Candidatus Aeolococcus gillhamiae TaxID=3127015 RepID=A0A2W5ZF43_9BACT|nr:hypothetical protein [Candidatus Dormibacteraeota bacterium]PZR84092.1 MAG: hypothetical protein DLM65_00630 [Candidatus Dormibacter sp. RRmetagenome_bin12]
MLAVVVESLSQTGPIWWIPLGLALVGLAAGSLALGRAAQPSGPRWRRPPDALSRITGLPAWCAAGIALAVWSLAVALVGFSWDVAWHADLGRDQALFTPPHVMILVGLAGIGLAAVTSIVLATADQARVGLRVGRLRIPWSSLPMGLMATGALIGFPLDDYWHSVYGIDVTMWSPTHLLMIGGASLTPIAAWLMLAEAGQAAAARRGARVLSEVLAGATLIGLSTFQLEFDLGIPQWQALFHPALIALAMGVGLVAAREALGPGGALRATIGFLVLRGFVTLLVGPVFGLSLERFPLYIAGALVVEAVYRFGPRLAPALRVAVAGLLLATVGMAAEWGWTHLWSPQPWQARLLASWWVVLGLALVGSFLGSALGRAVAHTRQVMHFAGVGVAFALMVGLLAVPFPRHGLAASVTVTAAAAGERTPTVTREGLATFEQDMTVSVSVSPPTALDGADVMRVFTWQGGSLKVSSLRAVGQGRYVIDGSIPTGGSWKSIVFVEDGDVVAATPVSFPADPTYGLAAIPVPVSAPRTAQLQPASAYLTRESHGGTALPAVLAYSTLAIIFVTWCVAVIGVGEAMRRRHTASLTIPAFLHGGR